MNSLATDIRQLIARRIENAPAAELLVIASKLCAAEIPPVPKPALRIVTDPVLLDNSERFARIGEDVVADHATGLSWSRANVTGGRMDWKKAAQACDELRLGGFSDWRLPTVRELLTLIDYERREPSIDPVFECDSESYWTATLAACSRDNYAWIVRFKHGSSYWDLQYGGYLVRAVRSK